MSHRINYTSTVGDGYAISNGFDRDYERVARSIARRRGLTICSGPAPGGCDSSTAHYSVCLGRPCRSEGGCTPVEDVQFFIPLED